jgi:hypothetical protein
VSLEVVSVGTWTLAPCDGEGENALMTPLRPVSSNALPVAAAVCTVRSGAWSNSTAHLAASLAGRDVVQGGRIRPSFEEGRRRS